MNSFLDPAYPSPFMMFSTPHIVMIGVLLALAILLYVFRKQIQSSMKMKHGIRSIILISLIVPELCLYVWYTVLDQWDVQFTLPLELCSITQFFSIVMLMNRSRILYYFVFFAGIGGALQAVLTPVLQYPFPHFIYFYFFIVHMAIILAPLYMTWIENYRPSWKAIGITMLMLNGSALVVWIIDKLLDTNYMFLLHKPDTESILNLLGPYPYYIASEELIALFTFIVMYSFFLIKPLFRR